MVASSPLLGAVLSPTATSISHSVATSSTTPDDAMTSGLLAANWPTALPPSTASHVLSIVMGNTSWNWALHDGSDQDYAPTIFWSNSVAVLGDSKLTLAKVIPDELHERLFGSNGFTNKSAATYRLSLRVPTVHVYVVSTNASHEPHLATLFQKIPSLLYKLSSDDFCFQHVSYPGLGVDRLVTVAAAHALYPDARSVLVLDGGTAMTYTTMIPTTTASSTSAASASTMAGVKLAGGISAGLRLKFQSMHDYTDDLPLVDTTLLTRLVDEASRPDTEPMSIFSLNSSTDTASNAPRLARAMVGSILTETALLLSSIVQGWLAKLSKLQSSEQKVTTLPIVVVTGGDGDVYHKLLQPRHSTICHASATNVALLNQGLTLPAVDPLGRTAVVPDPESITTTKTFRVQQHRHLAHLGVPRVLVSQRKAVAASLDLGLDPTCDVVRTQMVGQRVVARDSKHKLVYGIVAEVVPGSTIDDDFFSVSYDDTGRIDDLNSVELYGACVCVKCHDTRLCHVGSPDDCAHGISPWSLDVTAALELYTKSGEKVKPKDEEQKIRILNKVKDAGEAMVLLSGHSVAVQTSLEKPPPPVPAKPAAAKPVEKVAVAEMAKKAVVEKVTAVGKPVVEKPAVAATNPPVAAIGRTLPDSTEAPPAKKQKAAPPVPATERDPKSVVGERIAKYFDLDGKEVLFFGHVTEYVVDDENRESWWHVEYDDEDNEDLEAPALNAALALYEVKKGDDPKFKK